jgi:ribosome-associated protein
MIPVTPDIAIDEKDLQVLCVRASGPGGQHVNKTATAVQLRFRVDGCTPLPAAVRQRLKRLAGRRLTAEGDLVIRAERFRSQAQNRQEALERLADLIRRASVRPLVRRATQPTLAARRRRLESKLRRSRAKGLRRKVSRDGE